VDGWWHYNHEGTRQTDIVRDETLRADGWQVLRISGRHLFSHPEEAKTLIVQHIAQPVMTNKRAWVDVKAVGPTDRFEPVYSFECIPDHNYVGDGVILHNCSYCQNFDISQRRKVEGTDMMPPEVAALAVSHGCQGLAYTYNQPTIFMEFAHDVGVEARRNGLINIFVSNGYDTPDTVGMMNDFLDCITIDFKGNAETDFVRKYIGIANAEPIFQTILEIRDKTKVHMEFTDLVIPEVGDKLEDARKLSRWLYDNLGPDHPIHFLRFHPDYKMMNLPHTPVKTLEEHCRVAREEGLRYVYVGNVPGHPWENTYCPECNSIAIKRYGFDITGWNLDENNRCANCNYQLAIVGGLSSSISEERFLPVIN
jgi:pyruvate formate lyase activating enzyme